MGRVTVQLESEPTAPARPESRRRRARLHLDAGPADAGRAAAEAADLATELGLGGYVRPDSHGVTVEVEGPAALVEEFGQLIRTDPRGWTDGGEVPPLGAGEFAVLAVSARRTAATAHRGSDIGLDGADVAAADRGGLRLRDPEGRELAGDPVAGAIALLGSGRIVASASPHRYRLYADATRPAAVAAIAAVTSQIRDGQVVALCPDLEWARRLARLDERQAAVLVSPRNPVLLVEPQPIGPAVDLAPPDSLLAVTLPGCALTHLLAAAAGRPLAFVDLPPAGTGRAVLPPANALLVRDC